MKFLGGTLDSECRNSKNVFRILGESGSKQAKGHGGMKRERQMELVCGSGNVFRDLGRTDADAEQLKTVLAAEIIKLLDREELTVRAAHAQTRIAAADFSRIRNADLGCLAAERFMSILNRLGHI